jgi:hypothetical protein
MMIGLLPPAMVKISSLEALDYFHGDVARLLDVKPVLLGQANSPNTHGAYMLFYRDATVSVGEVKGSQGLRDRLLRKHISGDDNHAIQRAMKVTFPDRALRRQHIKEHVSVSWVEVEGSNRISALERLLIWLYDPDWNDK